MNTWLLAAALAVCMSASAGATTFYVSTKGKDSNSGTTVSKPFGTIGKAAASAQPGDTVYVAPGTYTENVATVRAGTLASPIRFVADKSGAVFGIKKGNVTIKSRNQYIGILLSHNYNRFEGFRVTRALVGAYAYNAAGGLLYDIDSFKNSYGYLAYAADVSLQNCRARGNSYVGVYVSSNCSMTLKNCQVYSNSAQGVYVVGTNTSVSLRESQIYSNKTYGIEAGYGSVAITNCLIRNNKSDGVHVGLSGSGNYSGASAVTMWHTTLARNMGDGIEVGAGSATMTDCITAYNSGAGMRRTNGTLDHSYNLAYTNTAGNFAGTSPGLNEVQSSPQFTGTSNYTLVTGSPAINAGANSSLVTSTDLAGGSRPQGGGWDLGCYEGVAPPIFTDVSASLRFGVLTSTSENDGSGMAWVDIDDDGDLDCVVTGSTARVMTNGGSSFYSTILGSFRGQASILDANNDGLPDLWTVTDTTSNDGRLFLNTGGALVAEDAAGFTGPNSGDGACAMDVDRDGWMDLVMFSPNGNWIGLNGRSTTPVFSGSQASGWNASGTAGNGDFCSTADVNDDGQPDVFYHYNGGKLFLSSGTGTYAPASATSGSGATISFSTSPSKKQGSAWADYDGDGDVDLYVARKDDDTTGWLFENNDDGTFTEVSGEAGLEVAANGQRGCAWGDFDNDGDLDLYLATRTGGCQLYMNLGTGTFVESGLGADVDVDAEDCVFVDYDNDGDLDLALTRVGGGMMLLRNSTNNNRYLKVRVLGCGNGGTNKLGIGIRVELYDGSGTLVGRRDLGAARGYGGTEPIWAHFGGVTASAAYTLKVYFASGTQTVGVTPASAFTTIGSRTISQMVTVEEPPVGPAIKVVRWREASDDE
ncbi:hypothetical protein PHYC_03788 [Phycisphaerales bacterium]|nr:hypothetical protein PHYC_03788 [Phycisphaerales bacterium]